VNDSPASGGTGGPTSEVTVQISNPLGLHARPAAEFVKLSSRFQSHISVEKDGLEVNGKSIMGVMMLAAECGSRLRIRATGPDHGDAVASLSALVRDGFGESRVDYGEDRGEGRRDA